MNKTGTTPQRKILLVSDVNLEPLARVLTNDHAAPLIEARQADYGQLYPTLLSAKSADESEMALVWSQPESAIPEFRKALEFLPVDQERLLQEARGFAEAVLRFAERFKSTFVCTWSVSAKNRGLGLLNFEKNAGISRILARMNLELAERLDANPKIRLLDAQRWFGLVGERAHAPKLWYLSKTPYSAELFREAAADIKSAVTALEGGARKLLVVDLDDTLWGGVVGDVGWQALRLGGHDYLGEAYVDFQRALKALRNRGILLAVASKNDEAVALEAMREHPEMVLRPDDFSGFRINWKDKAQNIADLAAELNLGLQSVVFVDENPLERARVRDALAEVFVPEWPQDPAQFKSALQALTCFDNAALTEEDRKRHELYSAEKTREKARVEVGSADDWIRSLGTVVTVEPLSDANLQRAAQLLNKTNQMNLATRRMTEPELKEWAAGSNRAFWTFRVSDKFGDSGLTGLISLEWKNGAADAYVCDYVLSCRVMGRRVEESLLHTALRFARERCVSDGVRRVVAHYAPTAKNKPCLEFFKASGLQYDPAACAFSWDLSKAYPVPGGVTIVP